MSSKADSNRKGGMAISVAVVEDDERVRKSLAGYLLKPVRSDELLAALTDVFAGGAPLSSSIARKVVRSFQKSPSETSAADDEIALSPREKEVLDLLVKGYLYKEIGDQLTISYSTVHTHIERIYNKLHVRSRAQAVAKRLGC